MAPSEQEFQFVSIANPKEAQSRSFQRSVRSHAVRQGLHKKRQQEQSAGQNFRIAPLTEDRATQVDAQSLSSIPTLSEFRLNERDSPAHYTKLRALFSSDQVKQALEPVFSIGDDVAFQTFRSVFRTSLNDPALLNAILLTATFAIFRGILDQASLQYQTKTIQTVRQRVRNVEDATITSTLGAILLLAGIEIRLGMRPQVELHLKAVRSLLEASKTGRAILTDGIKRAIFWQDLYAHVLISSHRMIGHTTFTEMHWQRDVFSPQIFLLPIGFQRREELLGEELCEVLKDVHALQHMRDSVVYDLEDTAAMLQMDNQQASIQSRLSELPRSSSLRECCRFAAYLAASMLCCKVWRMSVIPARISSQLLLELQNNSNDSVWEGHLDLLTWILYLGGAFAPVGPVRAGYTTLISREYGASLNHPHRSWNTLVGVMEDFVWSKRAFAASVREFWEQTASTHDY